MKIDGIHYRSLWLNEDGVSISIFDQTKLPFLVEIITLSNVSEVEYAIRHMQVRGAPLIGAVAAYGLAIAMNEDPGDDNLYLAYKTLVSTRPTAINLKWALDRLRTELTSLPPERRKDIAYQTAGIIADEDVTFCKEIGRHGKAIIQSLYEKKGIGDTVNILTHCNAGWLATVDWGTALAPIYMAHDEGIKVHVWVDETRPRNQGSLTAFELGAHGIEHTLIADNAGGHLMQHGLVDMCIVGSDRTTARGDVCNKVGTYLKALAAKTHHIPFYVALPSSTIDFEIWDGLHDIPIEKRSPDEVSRVFGIGPQGKPGWVDILPEGTPCENYAFDVTPAEFVTGLITERGTCRPLAKDLKALFSDLVP
ncbi:S-methyl-5-thioribose-1-phosphate isomerase [Parasalinivibrio latis]|uniref:S-methyl-5-thioribose-1-phosphate isomerase n=1 Tax=Parasalinivibrio latis TaxID=2952610 RepID=UPI0030E345DF